jgi:hypothetical protein
LPQYAAAFAANLSIIIYSGDVDVATCPFAGTQYCVEVMQRGFNLSVLTPWSEWKLAGQTAGFFVEYSSKFLFATVKGAGHEAPGYQPAEAYALFKSWLQTGRVPTAAVAAAGPGEAEGGPGGAGATAVKAKGRRRMSQGAILANARRLSAAGEQ